MGIVLAERLRHDRREEARRQGPQETLRRGDGRCGGGRCGRPSDGRGHRHSQGKVEGKNEEELIEEANAYYNLILDSMNQQDWTGIGNNFGKLGEVLNVLSEK